MRQYIGARYVPKFDGDWVNNKTYEALTIVNYMGDSYTSKKSVPAGVVPTNTTYWALTGAYNSQISSLSTRVDGLSNNVDILNDVISSNHLNMNIIFIGDSYAGTFGSLQYGWMSAAKTALGLDDDHAHFYKHDGWGVAGGGFSSLADDAIADITDPGSISHIIIGGGCNDHTYSISDINTARVSLENKLHAAFPNALIRFAMIGGFISGKYRTDLFNKVKYVYDFVSDYWRMPIINAHLPMCFTGYFGADGIHPTEGGCTVIGYLIASAIVGNSLKGKIRLSADYWTPTLTKETGVGGTAGNFFKLSCDGDDIRVQSKQPYAFTGSFAVTWNNAVEIELGTITDGLCCNSTADSSSAVDENIPVVVRGYAGGTGASADVDDLAGSLVFYCENGDDTTVHMRLYVPNGAHEDKTYTYLYIRPFNATINH